MSSTAPDPKKREPKKRDPKAALIFDDPLSAQSADDSDHGWGERPTASDNSAADLARFLDEKPPHHI
ncbi:hypothetical protein ACN2WE_17590 [Streptomyces sp. cg28]|uniref:hypothetical protein n=1 Tax=unclassified Streptomyces TaxID=2593676 RepID=UPI000DBA857B|nr:MULTISPECIES: hypothetical protein [unclassified Streptomyces]MYT72710.1 hypothetical protein [Streptomyces sp. SID8367]RAJ79567.1 hypothetical protein K377_05289 [Streptomyces sp. PsTaAH-137]